MTALTDAAAVETAVRKAVAETPITDVHTHLFPPSHGNLLLWGIDEVLRYHYLVAELFTIAPRDLRPEDFRKMTPRQQADLVWEHSFLKHGPLSEARRGVMTILTKLGLDVAGRDLDAWRTWYEKQDAAQFMAKVFEIANIDTAVMTNNPFDAEEAACWRRDLPCPEYLRTAIRVDEMFGNWSKASKIMRDAGYETGDAPTGASAEAARKFIVDWAGRIKPIYMAASLPDNFTYPVASDPRTDVVRSIYVPAARELGIPLALMIGVRRRVNPALGDGGDCMGVADVEAVANLCIENPDMKFLATFLSRVNQHELCATARKFGNLHIFGCWWFCNTPSIIGEITRQRIELLGTAFTCQHGDARVLDQLLYKWSHTRTIVADVLAEKYLAAFTAGWRPTEEEIHRDARAIFGGSFWEFMAK